MEQRLLLPSRIATRRIFVAHHDRWLHLGAESRELIRRTSAVAYSQHGAASTVRQLPCSFCQPFDHEDVVAEICQRMTRQQPEEDDNWLPERICGGDSRVERKIVKRALRSAHPVHDTSSAWINRLLIAHRYTRINRELLKRRHACNLIRTAANQKILPNSPA